jgi:SynChlorMet cassette radical SAM/SPASM protein ScmE
MKIFSAPQKVTLNITNQCNLHCLYCAVSASKNASGNLNFEEWERVIDELGRIKVFNLVISGGEPFLRLDFFEILKTIFRYHFRISINTNGTIVNEAIFNLLAHSNRLDNIQISLDGPDSQTHDRIRGMGSFDRIMDYVKVLRRWTLPFSFNVVVCRNNKDLLEPITAFAKRLGAVQVTFSPLSPQGSALAHLDDLFLSFEEEKSVEADLKRLRRDFFEFVGGNMLETFDLMDRISHMDISQRSMTEINKITSCGGSISDCSIRPEGWVIPCDRLWDYRVGNVRDKSFQSIWLHSEGFREFRKRYLRDMDSFEECRRCPYTCVCRGGCPAVPYNFGKGIDGWDPFSCYLVYLGRKKSYV